MARPNTPVLDQVVYVRPVDLDQALELLVPTYINVAIGLAMLVSGISLHTRLGSGISGYASLLGVALVALLLRRIAVYHLSAPLLRSDVFTHGQHIQVTKRGIASSAGDIAWSDYPTSPKSTRFLEMAEPSPSSGFARGTVGRWSPNAASARPATAPCATSYSNKEGETSV